MKNLEMPSAENQFLTAHIKLISDNFQRLLNQPLFNTEEKDAVLAEKLFHAPFALLSHDNEPDPIFNG